MRTTLDTNSNYRPTRITLMTMDKSIYSTNKMYNCTSNTSGSSQYNTHSPNSDYNMTEAGQTDSLWSVEFLRSRGR